MMIRKIIMICLTVWVVSVNINIYGSKLLKNLINERKWEELSAIFLDDSYQSLKNYFSTAKSLNIITSKGNKLTYKAKFSNQGEIGVITFDFEKKEGKYSNVQIRNQIQPLYFIEKFKKYKANNIRLTVGDAQLHFISGYFLETLPFQSLLLFKGKWRFHIKPNDREEQLTLNRIYKRDYFSQSSKTGIFILTEKDFLEKLPPVGEVQALDKECQSLFKMYREAYGINIKQFNEYWYLPFPNGTNLVVFKKDKESFYYYSYNINLVPDTRLSESRTNDMILNYNSHQGIKLSFGEQEQVSGMRLNIFFNPRDNFISGTTTITYKRPTSLKLLDVARGLQLVGTLNLDARGLNVFRKRDRYYLLGPEDDTIALYFRGHIKPGMKNFELFKSQFEVEQDFRDEEPEKEFFYFLSRTDNFYPNPGDEFFETQVTVTVPDQLNCLASGHLREKTGGEGEPVSFKFSSVSSKGISAAIGDFALSQELDARVPLHFYTLQESRILRDLDMEELKEGFNFFTQTFGPLDIPGINILLRPGALEGGISNNGFIVVNFFERKRTDRSTFMMGGPKVERKILSPILIRDSVEDYILHELAHQWWGGVISWRSYRDTWLTEGLAHFSVLYFLKKKMSEKQFNRIIKKLKRWVYRHSDSGPIIYGTRIRSLENRYEPFQSVVYNRSALVFFMVLDLIGEQAFNQRLKSVLEEFKYKSISSMQFIRHFCGTNSMLLDFFRKWVYSRDIPEVELGLVNDDPAFDTKEFKQVVLSITQLDSDFIFPLDLKVTTQKGSSIESIVIKEKTQRFIISRDSTIRSIDIEDGVSPVKEKKQLQPRRWGVSQ
ncbi:MAG: hypothetical protein JSV88_09870 [Candidatus Aminicenantes bacterium]|nr:MAG: hypothetical protein JSV88_09870 [Candidatus Aminicenantes bacterium]